MLVFDIILLVALILMMIGLGLRVGLPQILQSLRDWPTLLLIGAGEYLLMPLLAWLVIAATGATGPDAGAVAMVMLGPGSAAAAAAVFLARANLPLAVTGIVLTNVITPLVAPLLMRLIVPARESAGAAADSSAASGGAGDAVAVDAVAAEADLGNIALIFFLSIVLPLVVGMALRPFSGGLVDATARPFRVFIWMTFGLSLLYAVMLQASLGPDLELAPALPALAGIVAATAIAVVAVYAVGQLAAIRPENAVTAAFVVGLQPVAMGLYVAIHQVSSWTQLTELSIGYALALPFLIVLCILLAGRRLHLPGRHRGPGKRGRPDGRG